MHVRHGAQMSFKWSDIEDRTWLLCNNKEIAKLYGVTIEEVIANRPAFLPKPKSGGHVAKQREEKQRKHAEYEKRREERNRLWHEKKEK